jgi:hypothetical protein
VPAEGEIPISDAYAKLPFTKDTVVEAVELLPGDRAAVHHSIAFLQPSIPTGMSVDASGKLVRAAGTATASTDQTAAARSEADPFSGFWLSGYAPGHHGPYVVEKGLGMVIPGNSYVRFNMHYQAEGVPTEDVSVLGFAGALTCAGRVPPAQRRNRDGTTRSRRVMRARRILTAWTSSRIAR